MNKATTSLSDSLDYKFTNPFILKKALTHRSYAVEKGLDYDNQRLEFLGDAVVEIVLTEYLFVRYQNDPEGRLTKMRSGLAKQESLARMAREMNLGRHIFLGKGERDCGGDDRESTLADAFEALMGAIYLDGGLSVAKDFLLSFIENGDVNPTDLIIDLNPKGMLQEFTQRKFGLTPTYSLKKTDGPDHAPQYMATVSINGKEIASGAGCRRKAAESEAAKAALRVLMDKKANETPATESAEQPDETPAGTSPANEAPTKSTVAPTT